MADHGGSGPRRTRARRSTITALLPVAAAVIAVAVVAYVLARNPTLAGAPTVSPARTTSQTPTPTTTTTATASETADRPTIYPVPSPPRQKYPLPEQTVTVTPGDVPTGGALSLAYYLGADAPPTNSTVGYIHSPGDGVPEIPVHLAPGQNVGGFTQFGTGYLVLVHDELAQADQIRYYKSPGHMVRLSAASGVYSPRLAVAPDGSVAIPVTADTIALFDRSGKKLRSWTFSSGAFVQIVHVYPDHSVLVYRGNRQGRTVRRLLEPNGDITSSPAKGFWAASVSPANGDMAENKSCGVGANGVGLLDKQTLTMTWVDCNYQPGPFNADGTTIASVPNKWAYRDNYLFAFLDPSTGDIPVGFRASSSSWGGVHVRGAATWEDGTHVLLELCNNRCRLLRFGLDGTVEKVPVSLPVNQSFALPE